MRLRTRRCRCHSAGCDPNRHKAALDLVALNCRRQKLASPGEKLARCNPMRACNLRDRSVRLRRLRHDPKLLFPTPAPPPLNRSDHLDPRHRAMPIVTISTALRAISEEKTRQPSEGAYVSAG